MVPRLHLHLDLHLDLAMGREKWYCRTFLHAVMGLYHDMSGRIIKELKSRHHCIEGKDRTSLQKTIFI